MEALKEENSQKPAAPRLCPHCQKPLPEYRVNRWGMREKNRYQYHYACQQAMDAEFRARIKALPSGKTEYEAAVLRRREKCTLVHLQATGWLPELDKLSLAERRLIAILWLDYARRNGDG